MRLGRTPDPADLRAELDKLDRLAASGFLSSDAATVVAYRRTQIRRQLADLDKKETA